MIHEPKCKHCGNTDESMMEIEVIDQVRAILCNVCSKTSIQLLQAPSYKPIQTSPEPLGTDKKSDE